MSFISKLECIGRRIKLIEDLLLSDCREEDLDLLCRYSLNNLILEPLHSLYARIVYLQQYSYNYYQIPILRMSSLREYIDRDKAELFDSRLRVICNKLSYEKKTSVATSATIFAVAGSFGAQYIQYIKNGGRTSSSGMHHIRRHQHQLNKFLEREKVLYKLKRGISLDYNYKRTGLAVWSNRKITYKYKTKPIGKKGVNAPIDMKIKVSIKDVQLASGHELYLLLDRKSLPQQKKNKISKGAGVALLAALNGIGILSAQANVQAYSDKGLKLGFWETHKVWIRGFFSPFISINPHPESVSQYLKEREVANKLARGITDFLKNLPMFVTYATGLGRVFDINNRLKLEPSFCFINLDDPKPSRTVI